MLNEDGEVVDRGRFRTTPKALKKWLTDQPPTRVVMEAGTRSIWVSGQLQELGHEVIVANVRELRAISHSDRRSDQVDAEKLAHFARLDPKILRLNRPRLPDTMQAKASAAKRFRSNGDVRSQTEPGPCRCTTSPMPTSGPDLFPRSARLGGQTEDLGTGGLHAIPVTTTRSMPWILER
jgi:xanthine dehydrogenase iron-sulfur cluster and FAD-binding subunit A